MAKKRTAAQAELDEHTEEYDVDAASDDQTVLSLSDTSSSAEVRAVVKKVKPVAKRTPARKKPAKKAPRKKAPPAVSPPTPPTPPPVHNFETFTYAPFRASRALGNYETLFAKAVPMQAACADPSAAGSPLADLFCESTIDYTSEMLEQSGVTVPLLGRDNYDVGSAREPAAVCVTALNTGFPFPRTVKWSPFSYKEGRKCWRYLLVSGLRTPQELTVISKNRTPEWHEREAEMRCGDIARFSRVLTCWRVEVMPLAEAGLAPTNAEEKAATLELCIPEAVPSEWSLRDFTWLGKGEDVLAAVCVRQFRLVAKEINRRGIIATCTNKGHVAVYAIPDVSPDEHLTLQPFCATQSPNTALTTVIWHTRGGEACLFCGTLGGDILNVVMLPKGEGAELIVVARFRAHSYGFVRKLEVMTLWHLDNAKAVVEDPSLETPYPQDCLPPLEWADPPETNLPNLNVNSMLPDLPGAQLSYTLVSLGQGELKLRMWDTRMLYNASVHGTTQGTRARCFLSTFTAIPGGPLLGGNEDSSIDTQPLHQVLPGRPVASSEALLFGGEAHAPIFHLHHASDSRRRKAKTARPVDGLLALTTSCGSVKLVRYVKRAFSNCIDSLSSRNRSTKICPTCMQPGVQLSMMGCACACRIMPKKAREQHISVTNMMVTMGQKWTLPAQAGERPKVSMEVKMAPSSAQYAAAQDNASELTNFITQPFDYPMDLATSDDGCHMIAVALPGGVVLVMPF